MDFQKKFLVGRPLRRGLIYQPPTQEYLNTYVLVDPKKDVLSFKRVMYDTVFGHVGACSYTAEIAILRYNSCNKF